MSVKKCQYVAGKGLGLGSTIPLQYGSLFFSFRHLTPESQAALAVEHFSLLDLACGAVLAGIGQAGVVATFAHTAAVQTVTSVLLQVEHPVVDVQQTDAADQTCGHPGPFHHTEGEKDQG